MPGAKRRGPSIDTGPNDELDDLVPEEECDLKNKGLINKEFLNFAAGSTPKLAPPGYK